MCDQDHFEQDRLEYEAGGLVTRRQFGILLGAGGISIIAKRLRLPSGPALPSPERGSAD